MYFRRIWQQLFSRRQDSLWVFGAWAGKRYDDNTRYLFEYVNDAFPNVDAVWVSTDKNTVSLIKQLGYKAAIADSPEGISWQKRAGFAFYTNGIDDFGYNPYVLGAKQISMWHGVPIKRMYYSGESRRGVKAALRKCRDALFSWVHMDLLFASSSFAAKAYIDAFWISESKIRIAGQPRNEQLLRLRSNTANAQGNYVLYMPTYRAYSDECVEQCIMCMASDGRLIDYLVDNDMKLIIKLHFLTKLDLPTLPGCLEVLDGAAAISTQQLLAGAAVLVTDYSSCCIDYAILNRPIILYANDYEKYCEENGVLDEWRMLYSNCLIDSLQISDAVLGAIEHPETSMVVTSWINDRYFEEGLVFDGSFIKRVLLELKEAYPNNLSFLSI